MEAIGAMAAFAFVLVGAGWRRGDQLASTDVLYRQATAACLTAIVLMQVVNVHLCRSRRTALSSLPLFNNRLITAGIVAVRGFNLSGAGTAVARK
jgi:magnesium-transporting ATPase (P-type)